MSNNKLKCAMSSQFPGSRVVAYYKYKEIVEKNGDFQQDLRICLLNINFNYLYIDFSQEKVDEA